MIVRKPQIKKKLPQNPRLFSGQGGLNVKWDLGMQGSAWRFRLYSFYEALSSMPTTPNSGLAKPHRFSSLFPAPADAGKRTPQKGSLNFRSRAEFGGSRDIADLGEKGACEKRWIEPGA